MSRKFNFERFVSWLDLIYCRIYVSVSGGEKSTSSLIHSFIHWECDWGEQMKRIFQFSLTFAKKNQAKRMPKRTHTNTYKERIEFCSSTTKDTRTQTGPWVSGGRVSLKTGEKMKEKHRTRKKSQQTLFDTSLMWFYSQKKWKKKREMGEWEERRLGWWWWWWPMKKKKNKWINNKNI